MSFMFTAGTAAITAYSALENNRAIERNANEQLRVNKLYAERDRNIQNSGLLNQGQQLNSKVGMELTDLARQAIQARAATAIKSSETGIYGNTAMKQQALVDMKEALSVDSIEQKAESAMADIQIGLTDVAYGANAREVQASQEFSNSMSQRQSTFSILASSASAGMGAYSTSKSIQSSRKQLEK